MPSVVTESVKPPHTHIYSYAINLLPWFLFPPKKGVSHPLCKMLERSYLCLATQKAEVPSILQFHRRRACKEEGISQEVLFKEKGGITIQYFKQKTNTKPYKAPAIISGRQPFWETAH